MLKVVRWCGDPISFMLTPINTAGIIFFLLLFHAYVSLYLSFTNLVLIYDKLLIVFNFRLSFTYSLII